MNGSQAGPYRRPQALFFLARLFFLICSELGESSLSATCMFVCVRNDCDLLKCHELSEAFLAAVGSSLPANTNPSSDFRHVISLAKSSKWQKAFFLSAGKTERLAEVLQAAVGTPSQPTMTHRWLWLYLLEGPAFTNVSGFD